MFSWVALDRFAEKERAKDATFRSKRLVNRSSTVAELTAYSSHAGNEAGVLEQADS
jgi:hypothetical protein